MGIGIALASGFVKERLAMGAEKRAADAATAAAAAEYTTFTKQEDYKAGIASTAASTKRNQEIEDTKRANVATALQKGLEDGTLTPAGIQAIGGGQTTFDPNWIDLSKTASAMDAAEKMEVIRGDFGGQHAWNLVAPLDYDSGKAMARAEVMWKSWENQLSTKESYDYALDFYKKNPKALENLQNMVRLHETELRQGNIRRQRTAASGDVTDLQYIDLSETYGNAVRLFDELGFQNTQDIALEEIGNQTIDTEDDETPILFPTQDTADGGLKGGIYLPMKTADVDNLNRIAIRTGFTSAQQLVAAFNFRAGQRPEGVTDQDFAAQQNAVLLKAIKLEQRGYGEKLANLALLDKQSAQAMHDELKDIFGDDKAGMMQALSLMTVAPQGVFRKTKRGRYSSTVNTGNQPIGSGKVLVETITGVKADDFTEGLTAQEDAVDYLDQLITLEDRISENAGTGWVRSSAAFLASFGIQISQVPQAFGALVGNNSDFQALATGTDMADLQAIAQNAGIDLAAISEADGLRLTLAAKMARAVDPSGRLSNQDFEIQLRRLGSANFSSPQAIKASLELVRKEFAKDLEYKNMLAAVLEDTRALTPQVARVVQANILHRAIEKKVFGTRGRGGIVQDAGTDEATTPVTTRQSSKTLNGSPIYIIVGGPNDGVYSTDPEGTQIVPDDQVGNIR